MAEIDDRTIEENAERHRAKMAKRKAVQDAEVAGKTIEKGLLIVNTGPGKGKHLLRVRIPSAFVGSLSWARTNRMQCMQVFVVLSPYSLAKFIAKSTWRGQMVCKVWVCHRFVQRIRAKRNPKSKA